MSLFLMSILFCKDSPRRRPISVIVFCNYEYFHRKLRKLSYQLNTMTKRDGVTI